jgi:hypothetical protein
MSNGCQKFNGFEKTEGRGQKLFLLKINDLENISKIIAQKLVYIIYTVYIGCLF